MVRPRVSGSRKKNRNGAALRQQLLFVLQPCSCMYGGKTLQVRPAAVGSLPCACQSQHTVSTGHQHTVSTGHQYTVITGHQYTVGTGHQHTASTGHQHTRCR
eukprot:362138-Chlamydomonas_euryale.AAC.3